MWDDDDFDLDFDDLKSQVRAELARRRNRARHPMDPERVDEEEDEE